MQSMEEVYQKYAKAVYHYLLSLCRSHDIAEELTQETFYQAIKSIDRYDESYKVSTWLYAIAKNVYLAYRRKYPEYEDVTEQEIPVDSAENQAMDASGEMTIFKKIHELPEPYREIMYLRIYGGLSFQQIGEVYAKNETWARVTFYRSKEKLRKEMHQDE